jgi:beta-lactamase regulating signal transducer with metallopeptidase domain/protocatechuate 3,4-dioxygenase beta subunit
MNMAWHTTTLLWLTHAVLWSSLILLVGCLAVAATRQPVRRVRLIALTLGGALLAPCLGQLSWLPHWSAGWLRLEPAEAAPAALGASVPTDLMTTAPIALPQADVVAALVRPSNAPVSAEPASLLPEATLPSVPQLLALAYCGVVVVLLGRVLIGLAVLTRLSRQAVPVPPDVAELFRAIAGPAGDRVRLLAHEAVALPLTYRGWRPVILLPAPLCREGDAVALRFALAHEWSHIERGDLGRWYLATLAQLVFFYQPLLWWLRAQLRLCQDYLADARAAGQTAVAADYAAYLVRLARFGCAPPEAALGIGDSRSQLFRRVTQLLQTREPMESRCRTCWTAGVMAAALLLLAVCSYVRLDAGRLAEDDKQPPPAKDDKQSAPADKAEDLHYVGRVTDKENGKPIAGAVVTVRRSLYGDPEVKQDDQVLEATRHPTDAEGKYRFTIPAAQSSKRYLYIELDVEAPDYAPRKGFGYALSMIRKNEKLGGRPFFEHVELWPGKAITGRLLTPAGEPAVGVRVLSYSNTDRRGDRFEYGSFADARSDAEGRFRLTLITPGPAVFWLLPEKFAPSTHAVKEGVRGDLGTFTLQPGIVLHGKVVDEFAKPLPGVIVEARSNERNEALQSLPVADHIGRSTLTDAKGAFRFDPLPAGSYRIVPQDHGHDVARDVPLRRPLPAVFVEQKVVLKEGAEPAPLEVRAVPHVVIEAQYYDGKGKPGRGHGGFVFGRIDNHSWFGQAKPDASGKMIARVPHGLEEVRIDISTNEHGALRWRKGKEGPLHNSRDIKLGTLTDDVKGIEIFHYKAPILVINGVDKDGNQVKGFKAQVNYQPGKVEKQRGMFINGVKGDVYLEKQEDGRWRSSQMFPDEDVTVVVSAEGFAKASTELRLPEGVIREVNLTLEKETEKK